MNKLEEIRMAGLMKERCESDEMAFNRGFDSILALDLPVKFVTFMRHECVISSDEGIFYEGEIWSAKDLYNHWIDNVYKPE